jgi:hypothetical protein
VFTHSILLEIAAVNKLEEPRDHLLGEGWPNVKASEEDGYQGRSRRRVAEGDGVGRAPR